MHALMCR